jgi:hypothetical protein
MRSKKLKPVLLVVLILIVLLSVFSYFFVYKPYTRIKMQGMKVAASAKQVSAAFKTNNIDNVKANMTTLQKDYGDLMKESQKVYWMAAIPLAGAYVSDFRHGILAGESTIKAGGLAVDAIEPYADLIGFKKGANFFDKSADDRLETAVLTLDKVLIKVDDISRLMDDARMNLDQINTDKYPEKIGKTEVRNKLKNVKDQFDGIASLFVDAKPLIKQLPEILGSKTEKKYLVLFQNDKELRPTGGFLTAYAIFNINKGRIKAERSEDIYSLDDSISGHPKAPPEILKYHKGVSTFYIRDSNLSPDFAESVKLFNSLYNKSSQRIKYDGIFTVDTHVLVDILAILGDTQAGGITFSSETDKRCDCPQVVFELMNQIDKPVNYIKSDRKGLLGQLLYAIMQKSLGVSPSRYWGRLSQAFLQNLDEKHILVSLTDPETQTAIEKINFGGRIRETASDYLHINDTNFAGAKSNLFVQESVISDSAVGSNGQITRTVTINYKNPYPASDCNLERGNLCLNATLRNWVRVYVPAGSKLVDFQGSQTDVQTYDSLGKTVFEGFMTVNPMGKATVVIKYTLPSTIKKDTYKLYIQKQPGTDANPYKVTFDSKSQDINLITDKELSFK